MNATFPALLPDALLVVFDFDNTLCKGDSGGRLIIWLLRRNLLRAIVAIIASVLLGPLLAFISTRRQGIGGYLWIATFGLHDYRDLNALIDRYVLDRGRTLSDDLLPIALATLDAHRRAGHRVVICTGAPPELVHAILKFVAREDVPVVGSHEAPFLGGLVTLDHCHSANKLRCLRNKGYGGDIAVAYSDSSADLPLLQAARWPVVVNPKPGNIAMFRRALGPETPLLNWGLAQRAGDPVTEADAQASPSRFTNRTDPSSYPHAR